MFDNITAPRAKTRRGASTLVSILLHGAVIGLAGGLTYARAHMPKREEPVSVTFRPPPPPPPPPPAPAAHRPKTPRQTPKPRTPPRVAPIIQPKEIPKVEEKPPEVEENEPEEDEGVEGGVEGGVVGGVIGGVVGGVTGGAVGGTGVRMELDDTKVRLTKIFGPDPEYTEKAIEHEVQGLMLVKCVVTVEGVVRYCRVLKSLPFMDRAVVEALERRRYQPFVLNNRPIEIDYTFRIRLTLPQ